MQRYTIYAVVSAVFCGLAVIVMTDNKSVWLPFFWGSTLYWGLLTIAMAIKEFASKR